MGLAGKGIFTQVHLSGVPSLAQPATGSNSSTQDAAPTSDAADGNPIQLYLLSLTVSSVAVADPGRYSFSSVRGWYTVSNHTPCLLLDRGA